MTFDVVSAQAVIPVNVSLTDVLSQKQYDELLAHNLAMSALEAKIKAAVIALTGEQNEQLTELMGLNPLLVVKGVLIYNFIISANFGSATGYNSYGYVKKKYPIIDLTPGAIFKNKIKRTRIFVRLRKESENVVDYLNVANPIPEGERILLIMSALENVIDITLENATY